MIDNQQLPEIIIFAIVSGTHTHTHIYIYIYIYIYNIPDLIIGRQQNMNYLLTNFQVIAYLKKNNLYAENNF